MNVFDLVFHHRIVLYQLGLNSLLPYLILSIDFVYFFIKSELIEIVLTFSCCRSLISSLAAWALNFAMLLPMSSF